MQIRDILIFALSDAEQPGCDNNVTVVICYLYLNRVVHGWHFWTIFSLFLIPFLISFSKNVLENETQNDLENDHFSKIKAYPRFCKNCHFWLIFAFHFVTLFQALPRLKVTFPPSTFHIQLWHQRQRKRRVLLPPNPSLDQPQNELKNLHKKL